MATADSSSRNIVDLRSLAVPGTGGYLGSAPLVTRLVGEFAAQAEFAYREAKAGRKVDLTPKILKMAHVFSGEEPEHPPIKGYHGHTLPAKLRGDLGEYYAHHADQYGGDPVAVLFDWLAAHVVEACKLADGDDDALATKLKPSMQYTTQVLLGIEKRAG